MTTKTKTLSDVALERAREVQELAADPALARRRIYDGLAPVRMADPTLALELEEHYLSRIMFLAQPAPKPPPFVSPLRKLSNWKPSDSEAARFARYYAAAQAPDRLIDEVGEGRVTPETVETVKTLYPRYFEAYKAQAIQEILNLKKEMPYARRLALAQAFDMQGVEPTLNTQFASNFRAVLDEVEAEEEQDPNQKTGSRGGYTLSRKINAEKAVPKPTSAQRQGG
jgi:hypothetical protein